MDRKQDLSYSMNNFVGYVSDKASVSMAKLRGYESQDIDIAVVKATITDEVVPKEKHVRTLRLACSGNAPRAQVLYAIKTLAERLVNSQGWLVTLKTLMVFHRLIRECDPTFLEEILKFEERTGHHNLLRLDKFADHQTKETWDYSSWIRAYSVYLAERLEAFRALRFDAAADETKDSRLKNCPSQELLERLPVAQRLLTRLIGCVPEGHAQQHPIVQDACSWVLLESRAIYRLVSDGMLNLVDKYFEMEHGMALQGLEIYKENSALNERLNAYYGAIQLNPALRGSFQIPVLQSLPADFLNTMEEYVREAPKSLDSATASSGPRRAAAGPVSYNRASTLAARGGTTSSALGGTAKPPSITPPAITLKAPGPASPPAAQPEPDLLSFGSMSLDSKPDAAKPASSDPFADPFGSMTAPPAHTSDPGFGAHADPFGGRAFDQPQHAQGGFEAGATGFGGAPAFPQSGDSSWGAAPGGYQGGHAAGGFGDAAFPQQPQAAAPPAYGFDDHSASNPFGAPAFGAAAPSNPFMQPPPQQAQPVQIQPGFFSGAVTPPAPGPIAPGSNPFLAAPAPVPPPPEPSNPFKSSATMAPPPAAFEGKKLVADPLNMLTDNLFGNKKVETRPAVPLKDLKKPGPPQQSNSFNYI